MKVMVKMQEKLVTSYSTQVANSCVHIILRCVTSSVCNGHFSYSGFSILARGIHN